MTISTHTPATTHPAASNTATAHSASRRSTATSTRLGTASIGLAAIAVALIVTTHVLRPDLDPSWAPISTHALGPHGWVMTLAFLAWGAATIAAGLALRPRLTTRPALIGAWLVIIGGFGPVLAGVFPTDPVNTTTPTVTGAIHQAGAVLPDLVIVGSILIAWYVARRTTQPVGVKVAAVAATVAALAAAAWVSVALSEAMARTGGVLGPDTPVGWANRTSVVAYVVLAAVLGVAAGRLHRVRA